ncbi:hypothetical protein CMQ_2237 [Grosmannia clavigera kw1407]|uniref:Uncharacterized protein n=1 Tax=Grosmannia clavigera (strain kw1407 / UAMH 11150) TaxID=655863 RepID=F0XJF1_GROCL|nr:uncharacterized protein CMQ_2237 [Grosmannia clavigera kw1407]EFX02188.1 hypothetical protein CMQ_2237 [Grosmannia clavigera kw1407]
MSLAPRWKNRRIDMLVRYHGVSYLEETSRAFRPISYPALILPLQPHKRARARTGINRRDTASLLKGSQPGGAYECSRAPAGTQGSRRNGDWANPPPNRTIERTGSGNPPGRWTEGNHAIIAAAEREQTCEHSTKNLASSLVASLAGYLATGVRSASFASEGRLAQVVSSLSAGEATAALKDIRKVIC